MFGWKFDTWEGPFDYWLITTGKETDPGMNGGLNKREKANPVGTVNTIEVESVDQAVCDIVKFGGKIIREKTPVPGCVTSHTAKTRREAVWDYGE